MKLLAMDKAVTVQLCPLPGASALSHVPEIDVLCFWIAALLFRCSLLAAPLARLGLMRCSPPTPGPPVCLAVPLLSLQSRCWHPHPGRSRACLRPRCGAAGRGWGSHPAARGLTARGSHTAPLGTARRAAEGWVLLSCDYAFIAASPHAVAILSMPNSIILRREFKSRLLLPKYCTLDN